MKQSILLISLFVCLILVLLPPADAKVTATMTCPGTVGPWVMPTTQAPGPYGSIYVETSPPGAVVYVNGENEGHSPVTVTGLWPGSYTVRAELAGYTEYVATTTISGATRAPIYVTLVPSSSGTGLYIMSSPAGAEVYLDGVSKGKAPVMIRDISAGSHTVGMTLSGYADWESAVTAPVSGTKTVSAVLKETGTDLHQGLHISSDPKGATITFDGVDKGVTPKNLNTIAAGVHILELSYPGYKSWKSTVNVPESGIKEVIVNLTPNVSDIPGRIAVASSPGNASVTLDGIFVGRTPAGSSSLNLDPRPPGEYALVVSHPGYRSFSTRVIVSANNVTPVMATLDPVSGPDVKGTVSIVSSPAGATILIDNETIGLTPFITDNVTAGDHRITIRLRGYKDYSASTFVIAGETVNVSATLIKGTPALYTPVSPLAVPAALALVFMLFLVMRRDR